MKWGKGHAQMTDEKNNKIRMKIPAIRVNQWLTEWDGYRFLTESRQRKPENYFYVSSMPVSILRRLSNVPRRGTAAGDGRRQATGPRQDDIGIQRGFEGERSDKIRNFVKGGYPWATLSQADQEQFQGLKKPGWLPTALVVNIVKPTTERQGTKPDPNDLVEIQDTGSNVVELLLPHDIDSSDWKLKGQIHPLEIIDGQHRLLSFDEEEEIDGQFDLPVVLFNDLDISWQAYLFWTINITPKRIGPSLAYDLYPLLRTEDWLEPIAGPLAYRETRAQELTEALWSNPESPWYQRIGMLGRERGKVTQAAFVRSLTLSFIRRSDIAGDRPGGLFGAPLSDDRGDVLPWSRAQQAAYLIFLWSEIEKAIQSTDATWAGHVRENTKKSDPDETGGRDPAYSGLYSLLATDQGVRGVLQVANDVSFDLARSLNLNDWKRDQQSEATDSAEVSAAIIELGSKEEISTFIRNFSKEVAQFDWSSSVTKGLSEASRNRQALYRAGSGYREVRRQLLFHLSRLPDGSFSASADRIIKALKFDQ